MPDLSDIKAITYPNPLVQFVKMSEMVGGQVIEVDPGRDINALIRELFPDAKEIASNLPEITIATRNPDTVGRARDLNGTDVGVMLYLGEPGDSAAKESDSEQHARGLQAH